MTMEIESKRIEKNLYRRQYQTGNGEWTTLFYAAFVDWTGKRRTFPLGSDLKTARKELAVLRARNIRREDFDADKVKPRTGLTFTDYGTDYFDGKVDPDKRAGGVEREKRSFKTLKAFFGDMLLSEIDRSKVMEYRAKRSAEPIIRRGKPVAGSKISFSTVNRELAFLRYLLNLAADDGIIDKVPRVKLKSERERKRDRIVTDDEYRALLHNSARPVQRVLIALYESAMRSNEVIGLPWPYVDEKAGFIRLPAEYVKDKKKRTVPISPELRAVLAELRAEQSKVANISNRVFTRNGRPMKSIRTAFDVAKEKAGINDLRPHDFRHTCITRWTMAGIPREIIMAASGHASIEMHDRYVNVKEHHLAEFFTKMQTTCRQENEANNEEAVSG
jgi:integrase